MKDLALNPAQIQLLEQRGCKVTATKKGPVVTNSKGQKLNTQTVAEFLEAANPQTIDIGSINKLATREARRTTQVQLAEAEKREKAAEDLELMQATQTRAAQIYQQFLIDYGIQDGQSLLDAATERLQKGSVEVTRVNHAIECGTIAKLNCRPDQFVETCQKLRESFARDDREQGALPQDTWNHFCAEQTRLEISFTTDDFASLFNATDDPLQKIHSDTAEILKRGNFAIASNYRARDSIIRLIGKDNGPVKILEGSIKNIEGTKLSIKRVLAALNGNNPHRLKQILLLALASNIGSARRINTTADNIGGTITAIESIIMTEAGLAHQPTLREKFRRLLDTMDKTGPSLLQTAIGTYLRAYIKGLKQIAEEFKLTRSVQALDYIDSFIAAQKK